MSERLIVKPGEWYFAVPCAACKTPIPALHDPSRGKVTFEAGGFISIACQACGKEGKYPTGSFVSGEAKRVS